MSTTPHSETNGRRVFFDAILRPHRSLPPRGFFVVMLVLAAISITAGTAFLMMGAWPVFGFFGLDVALVYLAFRLNYRSGRMFETVTLTDASLDVRRVKPSGSERRWTLEPTWVRVLLRGPDPERPHVVLRSREDLVQIGDFLPPAERQGLATAIESALVERRQALPHLG